MGKHTVKWSNVSGWWKWFVVLVQASETSSAPQSSWLTRWVRRSATSMGAEKVTSPTWTFLSERSRGSSEKSDALDRPLKVERGWKSTSPTQTGAANRIGALITWSMSEFRYRSFLTISMKALKKSSIWAFLRHVIMGSIFINCTEFSIISSYLFLNTP